MAKYKLTQAAYIGDALLPEGAIIGNAKEQGVHHFDGIPGDHMEPIDDEAKADLKKAQDHRKRVGAARANPLDDLSPYENKNVGGQSRPLYDGPVPEPAKDHTQDIDALKSEIESLKNRVTELETEFLNAPPAETGDGKKK